jgi:putative salt-induced outer membrane protein YdiY
MRIVLSLPDRRIEPAQAIYRANLNLICAGGGCRLALITRDKSRFSVLIALAALQAGGLSMAQAPNTPAPPKPMPDVLTTTNGEKLIGHLVRAVGGSVTFHSDTLGDVTVDWGKIQQLDTFQPFAVIPKDAKLRGQQDAGLVPQGTVTEKDNTITVTPAAGQATQTVPVANAGYIVDEARFRSIILRQPHFLAGWTGSVTAGLSFLEATQNNRTFFGAVNLVRAVPTENWLPPRNRTIIDFNGSYSLLKQPNTPEVKTDLYHALAERDEYFTKRVYGFGLATFDHNSAQGLDLQQVYGGGIGWTIIDRPNQTFDVKGTVNYERQQFQTSAATQSLVGSTFTEHYNRKLPHGLVFNEQFTVVPAWSNMHAYWMAFNTGVTMALSRRFSFSTGIIDTYLNNPPVGFQTNSFQLTAGVAYSLQ